MIYDLKELAKEADESFYENASPNASAKVYYKTMLAIAERLELFVESQRPRFVEIDVCDPSDPNDIPKTIAFNDYGFDSVQAAYGYKGFVVVAMTNNRSWYVKGTVAEVMAKLRG